MVLRINKESNSEIPCRVRKLPAFVARQTAKLANNGEALPGVI